MARSSHGHEHDHEDAAAVTDRVHETSWSANLEKPTHGEDLELVLRQAVEAIERTASGYHVNLVTHKNHGHPSDFLFGELERRFDEDSLGREYVEQCGCGGHVTRVHVS